MHRILVFSSTRLRTVVCALLAALACSAATAQEAIDIRIAFQDTADEGSLPTPPQHPGPATSRTNDQSGPTAESLSTTETKSPAGYEPQQIGHYCRAPGYTRWPIVGSLHRRWITRTKPGLQASHWGYPEYFEERPYGSDVLQAEQMQVVNGLRDQQVLYHYDFYTGDRAAELKPRGEYQLRKIIRRMEIVPCPIIVQSADVNNPDPELDEARRQHVLEALAAAGVPVVPEQVVVDRPPVPGLQGLEGVMVYENMLYYQTRLRGGRFFFDPAGGGGSSSNASGGGSSSN